MDFDPRDYGDGRERDDFDVHEVRWDGEPRNQDDREREFDRERDANVHDPREPFVDGLELPRGVEREFAQNERENLYELNREDSLMLATIGAFRVVRERDLDDFGDAERTLDHLRREGLIHIVQIGADERAEVLTDQGRSVLEGNRRERDEGPSRAGGDRHQRFHAGVSRARELQHDSDLFRAPTAMATPIALTKNGRRGLAITTSRSSTTASISLTCRSTTSWMAAIATRTWSWSPSTIAARAPARKAAPGLPVCGEAARHAAAPRSTHTPRRISYERPDRASHLPERPPASCDEAAGLRIHRTPGGVPGACPGLLRRLRGTAVLPFRWHHPRPKDTRFSQDADGPGGRVDHHARQAPRGPHVPPFPDRLPIGIERGCGDRHVFVYLVRQPTTSEFRVFLARHANLARACAERSRVDAWFDDSAGGFACVAGFREAVACVSLTTG